MTRAIPDRASAAVPPRVKSGVETDAGKGSSDNVGAVLSRLISTFVVAVFPALSVDDPVTDCSVPCAVKVDGEAQLATPDSASLQLKVTVTSVLFHPLAFAAGVAVP